MTGKTSLDIVARHFLASANGPFPAQAEITLTTRYHSRNDYRLAQPVIRAGTGSNHASAYFVPQRQRQFRVGSHAVVVEAEVGVANAATTPCNLDHDFTLPGFRDKLVTGQRLLYSVHHPAICIDRHKFFSCFNYRIYFSGALNAVWPANSRNLSRKLSGMLQGRLDSRFTQRCRV